MPRRPAKVTQADIARAIHAAKEAGGNAVTIDGEGVARAERVQEVPRLHAGAQDDVHQHEAERHRVQGVDADAVLGLHVLRPPVGPPQADEKEEEAVTQAKELQPEREATFKDYLVRSQQCYT